MERRLAAILAADVVGYSRLIRDDEARTLAALKAHLEELIEPKIAERNGRIVKLMGDGLLAEFSSAVEAVQCAAEIQHWLGERNIQIPDEKRVVFRIGINVGDIVVEGDDIYGDGVNVAARLEGITEPGGICVSRTVFDHVKDKLDLTFENLGEKEVKNIAEPVTVYRVVLDDKAAVLVTPVMHGITKPKRPLWPLAVGVVSVLVLTVGGAFWWRPWEPDVEPASVEAMAFPLPDKPSIAVLPFANLGGDAEQDYLADGITEDIINKLSRFRDLFVIARASTFAYKGKPVKVQQVAEDLGVRYVLGGSVRGSLDRLRVTTQLVDALSGGQIWSETYDREPSEILDLQDDITQNIVARMAVKVDEAELERIKRKAPASLDAYDHVLRADTTFNRYDKAENLRARALYEKAIEQDPEYARAYTGLAGTHERDFVFGWSESPELSLQLAIEAAQKAIALDPNDYKAHNELGWAFLFDRRHEEGMAELEKAIALNPNDPDILTDLGLALIYVGKPSEALDRIETAMRLNPFHPEWYWDQLAFSHYYNRQYEEAIRSARRVSKPWAGIYRELAASYAQLDRMEEAREAAAKVLELEPEFATEIFRRSMPFKVPDDVNHYLDALHKAGLPEHPPLPLPDRPSIAVLPFTNMSGDPEQEYFADGMTEDLITNLSKVSGLFVIARSSSFAYKGKSPTVRRVAEELGVRYVLEGSVRRAGDTVRINTQLIDAKTGGQLWAERYDGVMTDVFTLQDQVTSKIITALAVRLTDPEKLNLTRIPTENLEAYDNFLRAERGLFSQSSKGLSEALSLYRRATEIDPTFARAWAGHARAAVDVMRFDWFDVLPGHVARRQAYDSATRALSLDRTSSRAYSVLGILQMVDGRYDEAIESASKAVSLNPSDADAHLNLALVLAYGGEHDESVRTMKVALRLNPKPPSGFYRLCGLILFMAHHYEQAIDLLVEGRNATPSDPSHEEFAMAYAQLGQLDEAKAEVDDLLKLWPAANLAYYRVLYAHYKREEDLELRINALAKAGLPEWPYNFDGGTENRLEGSEIKRLVHGRFWYGHRVGAEEFIRENTDDGIVKFRDPKAHPGRTRSTYMLEGTLSIDGDMLCYQYEEFLLGRKYCGYVFRNPEGSHEEKNLYVDANAVVVDYFTVSP